MQTYACTFRSQFATFLKLVISSANGTASVVLGPNSFTVVPLLPGQKVISVFNLNTSALIFTGTINVTQDAEWFVASNGSLQPV